MKKTWANLVWNVRPVAKRWGFATSESLAAAAQLDWRTVDPLWYPARAFRQHAQPTMRVETLRRLCITLDASPPGCFVWDGVMPDGSPRLCWRVPACAAHVAITTPQQFGDAAHIFSSRRPDSKRVSPADLLWAGSYRAIRLHTLTRVITVLRVHPGDLLRWTSPVPYGIITDRPTSTA